MEQLLGIDEVAVLLNVSKATLYGWTSRRRIPFIKVGRVLRFRASDVEAWIEKKSVWPDSAEETPNAHSKYRKNRGPKNSDNISVERIISRAKEQVLKEG